MTNTKDKKEIITYKELARRVGDMVFIQHQ